jgi:hypothetical protein
MEILKFQICRGSRADLISANAETKSCVKIYDQSDINLPHGKADAVQMPFRLMASARYRLGIFTPITACSLAVIANSH